LVNKLATCHTCW